MTAELSVQITLALVNKKVFNVVQVFLLFFSLEAKKSWLCSIG
jgi:hypothetical protein